jgi:hypothetical protein
VKPSRVEVVGGNEVALLLAIIALQKGEGNIGALKR